MTKVLIAEDDVTLRSAYKTKLTIEGMEVRTASDGEEALQIANEWNPDVILLDIMMPKKSGIEVLKEYDVNTKHPNCKVVVFSNLSTPDAPEEGLAEGAVKYLPKASSNPNFIVQTIKELLV